MPTAPAASLDTGQRSAVYSATVIARTFKPISFEAVFLRVKQIYPEIRVGTWNRPEIEEPLPSPDPGVHMISIDGEQLTVLDIDAPAPPSLFDIGPLRNLYMPEPEKVCAGHKAHYMIASPRTPTDKEDARNLARAVTILARAVSRCVDSIAISWPDADQIVPPELIDVYCDPLDGGLPFEGGAAAGLWVRILGYHGPLADDKFLVGTVGLYAFGARDLEFAPSDDVDSTMAHAMATAQHIVRSGAILDDGQLLGTPGQTAFAISHHDNGILLSSPICRLTPVPVS